jgi:hypothetical protein
MDRRHVGGGGCGHRRPGRGNVHSGRVARFIARVTTGVAAALGALITIPLVAVPTQDVRIVDTFAPNLLAGSYAATGVVIGLLVALPAMTSRAIAANVFATTGFLWLLATVAASDGGTTEVTQLGIWKFTNQGPIWHGYYSLGRCCCSAVPSPSAGWPRSRPPGAAKAASV